MFKDGNIQYANYQSKSDLATFMTANNVNDSVWGTGFNRDISVGAIHELPLLKYLDRLFLRILI
jgi:hypothetical protein